MEARASIRKHSSMSRLSRDNLDGDGVVFYGSPRRIVDSCVQTDDEDGEERYVSVCGWVGVYEYSNKYLVVYAQFCKVEISNLTFLTFSNLF